MASFRRAALFIGLTLAVSWAAVLIYYLAGGRWNMPVAVAFAVGYVFIPTIVAVVLHKLVIREPIRELLGGLLPAQPLVPGGLAAAACAGSCSAGCQPDASRRHVLARDGGPVRAAEGGTPA